LEAMLQRVGQSITVISDEPYKAFVYDGKRQTEVSSIVSNTAICNSWSKSLGLPGERIGYLALSPRLADRLPLRAACAFSNRILGFINAPAIWQRVLLESMNETIDAAPYEHKRNVLCDALETIGYDVRRPEGAFYIYLKTPIPDDVAFTQLLANEGVLAVPGTGFGRSGHIRLSLTIPLERIEKSIAGFERAFLAASQQ